MAARYVESGYVLSGYVESGGAFSRVTPTGWAQGDETSAASRVSPTGWQQFAAAGLVVLRPASDVVTGNWAPSSGVDLYAMLDEESPVDADYIYTHTINDTCEVALQATTTPAFKKGHTVRVRPFAAVASGTLTTTMVQGASPEVVIATWTDTLTGSAQTFEHLLTIAQANLITDYADVRFQFRSGE